jgi:Tol biopolymer transport system component
MKTNIIAFVSAVVAVAVILTAAKAALVASEIQPHRFDSRIAFLQPNSTTPGQDVYTMNPDGSDVRQLTNVGTNNSAFWETWSPDGTQLAFVEFPNNAPGQLWLMRADGSDQHLLLSEADYGDYAPNFSRDGVWLIFTRCHNVPDGNGCALYRIRTDGSGLTPVIDFQPDANNWEPVYSPDGLSVAFTSFERDGFIARTWLMNADGSDVHPLTPPELLAVNPSWSPDGEKIAFASHCCNPQNQDIWVIDRDGNGLHRLTGSESSDLDIPVAYYNQGPSWSPHEHTIAFQQFNPTTNISSIFLIDAAANRINQQLREFRVERPWRATSVTADHPATHEARHKRLHGVPRELEQNASLPRWSPQFAGGLR